MSKTSVRMSTRQISQEEIIPLRHEVLRPGKPRETAIFAGDELPTTTHWGALDEHGEATEDWSSLVRPWRPLDAGDRHGLTDADLADAHVFAATFFLLGFFCTWFLIATLFSICFR
jgi:hypothetical protein